MTSTYISGHHSSVLRSHKWRTVENSAAYLVPYLKPNMTLLDVGCGPGTITIDLARYLPDGHVWGIDPSEEVVEQARKEAKEQGVHNVSFEAADILDLSGSQVAGKTFDVVHAHQVLQHIPQALDAVKAMRNKLSPGGYLAMRCTDFETFTWWPPSVEQDDWKALFQDVASADGCDQQTARKLLSYCMKAGFTRSQVTTTAGSWCYSGPEVTKWWGDLWSERTLQSTFGKKAIERGFATTQTLENIAAAWKRWGAAEDAWFGMLHSEVVCHLSEGQ